MYLRKYILPLTKNMDQVKCIPSSELFKETPPQKKEIKLSTPYFFVSNQVVSHSVKCILLSFFQI